MDVLSPKTTLVVILQVNCVNIESSFIIVVLPALATVFPLIQGPYLILWGAVEPREEAGEESGYASLARASSLSSLSRS